MTVDVIYNQDGKVNLDWLYEQYRGICWICKRFCVREKASRDHIVPKSMGGPSTADNIALAHKSCNTKRGNEHQEIYARHFRYVESAREVTIMEDHGLIIQVWNSTEGFNVLVAKKRDKYDRA